MWVHDTHTAKLVFKFSPESISGSYAILSHVWGKDEQTFQETEARCKEDSGLNINLRERHSVKIRQACVLAESQGIQWLWVDTSCIARVGLILLPVL